MTPLEGPDILMSFLFNADIFLYPATEGVNTRQNLKSEPMGPENEYKY